MPPEKNIQKKTQLKPKSTKNSTKKSKSESQETSQNPQLSTSSTCKSIPNIVPDIVPHIVPHIHLEDVLSRVHEYIPMPEQSDEPHSSPTTTPTKSPKSDSNHNHVPVAVYSPYNEQNREITLSDVQSILTEYGVSTEVRNMNLYRRAFIHKSYTKKPDEYNQNNSIFLSEKPNHCIPLRTKSNERLEFIGDGVLECIVKYYLYKRFPKEDEGFMTEKKIAIVKNEHIGKLALDMGLHQWFIISKHAEEKNTRSNLKKLGCLFEAFLGALFLDFNGMTLHDDNKLFDELFLTGPGFQMAQIFLENVFEKHVDWSHIIYAQDNYKNQLQVLIQKHLKVTPHYIMLNSLSSFEMGVYIVLTEHATSTSNRSDDDIIKLAKPFHIFGTYDRIMQHYQTHGSVFVFLAKDSHKIKKKAEQNACKKALQILP